MNHVNTDYGQMFIQTKYCSQQVGTPTDISSMEPIENDSHNTNTSLQRAPKDVNFENSENETVSNKDENEEKSLEIDTNGELKQDLPESSKKSDVKKRTTSSTESTPVKKLRNKPKPQIVDNMKEYVDNNSIEKLTTTTLLHWLKERSLHCTTRDKKAELVQKVRNHILDSSNS